MAKHKQPEGFAPGIYFNMDESDYHKDKALSHSGITDLVREDDGKTLDVGLMDYWLNSPLNPHREFKESPAMTFGKQCHMFLMEEKKFMKTYNVAGGGYDRTKKLISSADFKLVKESTAIIRGDKDASEYFKYGYPEVSIFVICPATGIRLRIRIDFMRTFGCVDLKRLRSLQKKKVGYDIAQYGYDIQDYLYRYVLAIAKEQLRKGKIKTYGEVDAAWLKGFMDDQDTMFVFFLQRSTRPYTFRVFNFGPSLRQEAQTLTERGIVKYKAAIEKYGETGWPYGSAVPEQLDSDDMPRRNIL